MTELEKVKIQAIETLNHLCARCKEGLEHICPIQQVTQEIEAICGIPIRVNDKLHHVVFTPSFFSPLPRGR